MASDKARVTIVEESNGDTEEPDHQLEEDALAPTVAGPAVAR